MNEVDLASADRGVWIVKVSKALSNCWSKQEAGSQNEEVGKLKITRRFDSAKPDIKFTMSDKILGITSEQIVPKEHKFVISPVGYQTMAVFSHMPAADGGPSAVGEGPTEKIAIEGKVVQRAECQPYEDDAYMKMKRKQIVAASTPIRKVQHLKGFVRSYKPVSDHEHNIRYEREKKEQGKKSRADKDQVTEMLFNAFEKHQYYNVRDLVRITNQPITYLKEILKELCTYNMKAPHKNMWELKPEYRHYKSNQPGTSS